MFYSTCFLDPNEMVDLPNYIAAFNLFADNSITESLLVGYVGVKMEVGWIVLCKLLSLIYDNYIILLIFTSFVIVGSYIVSIYKFSRIVWLSIFIYLCTMFDQSLYVLRQHLAMAICLFAVPFVQRKELYKFLVVVLIATLIHTTALLFVIVYPFANMKYTKNFIIKLILISIVISLFSTSIFDILFSNTWYNSYGEKEGSNYTSFFIALCTFIFYIYSIKGNIKNVKGIEKTFFAMCILGVVISFTGVGYSPTNRLVKYFTLSSIFLIPIALSKINKCEKKYALISLIMLFYSLLFFSQSNIKYIEHYKLIFN